MMVPVKEEWSSQRTTLTTTISYILRSHLPQQCQQDQNAERMPLFLPGNSALGTYDIMVKAPYVTSTQRKFKLLLGVCDLEKFNSILKHELCSAISFIHLCVSLLEVKSRKVGKTPNVVEVAVN